MLSGYHQVPLVHLHQGVYTFTKHICDCGTDLLNAKHVFIYLYINVLNSTISWMLIITVVILTGHLMRTEACVCRPLLHMTQCPTFNTLKPRQDGQHFANDIFKSNFLTKDMWIAIDISLNFLPKGQNNNIQALVQIMAWRRPGDKPLSEPVMVSLLTHICVTRPHWVKMGSPAMHNRCHHGKPNRAKTNGQTCCRPSRLPGPNCWNDFKIVICATSHVTFWSQWLYYYGCRQPGA